MPFIDQDELPSANGLSRRGFLKAGAAAGGGLMLSLNLPFGNDETKAADAFVPNAFIRIDRNGQIFLTMPYVEMGQGTYTSIPMLIAEELEVDLKQVRPEHAPPNEKLYTNPLLGVQATGNSNAIRGAWQPLREAGATARTMLVSAAAKRWNVDPASCRAQSGEVLHGPTGRRLKYGELAADAARMPVPVKVALKRSEDFKLIGTRAKRLDTPAKVNGTAVYGIDVRVVAEVEVSTDGKVRVRRVVCAVDCGTVVNPDTVQAQIQSAIVFGITAALHGEITLKDGRVEQTNFDSYQMLRIDEAPAIEVYIVQSSEAPGGMGEAGTSAVVPAVTNAIFAATGKRLRKLPVDAGLLKQPS